MPVTKPLTPSQIALQYGQWIKNFEAVCFVAFWRSDVDKLQYLTWERNNIYFVISARTNDPKSFDPYRVNVNYPVYRSGQYAKYINDLKALLFQLRNQLAIKLSGTNIPRLNKNQILLSLDKLINSVY